MIKENDTFGIYTVLEITQNKTEDNHRIYKIKCNECGKVFEKPGAYFAYKFSKNDECFHLSGEEKRAKSLKEWYLQEHFCEHCGKLMTEYYGSGRFCSVQCANSKFRSEETKEKIRNSVQAFARDQHEKFINKQEKNYLLNPKYCIVCGNAIDFEHRRRKTCSDECSYKSISNHAKQRIKENGYNLQITIRNRFKYGSYKGIYCDSSWELAFIVYHLDNNINVIRNTKGFDYYINDEKHKFFPDFIVDNIYYEIKGYEDEGVQYKIDQFPHEIKLIDRKLIKSYLKYAINKYGKNFTEVLYDRNFPCYLDNLGL